MAKTYLHYPPQSIIDDPLRRAELRVFLAFRDLPEKYWVFYSVHWQDRLDNFRAYEGEADFIIAHPDKGVIVLEVKGGRIRYDADSGNWYSQSLGDRLTP